ncbi:citrate/2-methylcitrate synthase [Intrasporangium sp. YIM S08009]|uniref:citrate/2-methylcitrate synthase n=1 Tax=Intrasporangium zincisolvens TaxID=3080018 RepID=UPI002B05CFEC|nr:citrate/2-methylcitrate synthase [Intrasporangium sp. YIM S08009]
MTASRSPWITTTEAAQRLGVKRATLYAYVSRGLLRSERRPGQQESLFDRAQVEAMASATRAVGTPHSVLRFRTVATAVSSQVEGELRYRGVPLDDAVDVGSVERVTGLILGSLAPQHFSDADVTLPRMPRLIEATRPAARALVHLPLERRVPVAVQLLAASDPFAGDTDPERVRAAAPGVVAGAVALAGGTRVRAGSTLDPLADLTLAALGGGPAPHASEVVGVLLVTLLDHGLTASTVAARVAASTRAGLHDCLVAAYAAMAGPLHGAAPVAAHALLADASGTSGASGTPDASDAVARALRTHGVVPGFGHFLYPDGDPRAEVVLERVRRLPGAEPVVERVEALAAVVVERTGALPNIDLASAAALHALGLPAAAGEVLFQVARSFGVAAHVVEEYAEEPLRWRGRDPSA